MIPILKVSDELAALNRPGSRRKKTPTYALSLDGIDSYVEYGLIPGFNTTRPSSIIIRYMPIRISTEIGYLFGINGGANSFSYKFSTDYASLHCGTSAGLNAGLSKTLFTDNVFSHVAVITNAGGIVTVYFNGINNTINSGDWWGASTTNELGARSGGFFPIAGLFKEVIIYNNLELTSTQVLNLYNGSINPMNTCLYNDFTQGHARDLSGNGNHGTLQGNARFIEV